MVWIALIEASKANNAEEIFACEEARALVNSLCEVNTLLESSTTESEVDNVITAIARQNAASKVSPVTSYQWACILMSLGNNITFDQAIQKYARHPDVASHAAEDSDASGADSAGEGDALCMDKKKLANTKHWMSAAAPDVRKATEAHLHGRLWKDAALTERMLSLPCLWIGSVVSLNTGADKSAWEPLQDEQHIMVDWSLPLTPAAQTHLFERIYQDFERTTQMVGLNSHPKYRKQKDDLVSLRNITALWDQISAFCKTQIPESDFKELESDLHSRDASDAEMGALISAAPKKFAISMLPSFRKLACKNIEKREQAICNECEDERNMVRDAKMKYFQSALARDQERLDTIPFAIREARHILHEKYVAWLDTQTETGQKAVEWFMKRHLRMQLVSKPNQLTKHVQDFRKAMVSRASGLSEADIYCVILCDSNIPNGKSKQSLRYFAEASKSICDLNASRTVCVYTLPDLPCDSSAKGLDDEENKFRAEFEGAGFEIDTRFIVNTKPPANQRGQSNLRRWSLGRLTTAWVDPDDENAVENEWLQKSALAVHGRPDEVVTLPEQRKLLFPESLETNTDFRFADRKRPHPDQVVAQKGPEYQEVLLKELISGMQFNQNTQLLVVNVAPFVEDAGRAFIRLQTEQVDGWPVAKENFNYLSFHNVKTHYDWAVRKLQDVLENEWIANKVHAPGFQLDTSVPTVSEADLSALGGKGKAAMGDLTKLEFEVLVRDGMQMKIADDQRRAWDGAPDSYQENFAQLDHNHTSKYLNILTGLTFIEAGGNTSEMAGAGAECLDAALTDVDGGDGGAVARASADFVEYESVEEMEGKETVVDKSGIKVPGVTAYLTQSGKIFFCSKDKDKVIEIRTNLGSVGTGKYVPRADGIRGIELPVPTDRTLIEFDKSEIDGSNPAIWTMLQALRWVEKQGRSSFKVSFFDITRTANNDGFTFAHDSDGPQVFKLLSPAELKALENAGAEATPAKVRRGNKKADDGAVPGKVVNSSTFFGLADPKIYPTGKLQIFFRYRVLVGKNLKIAKPYALNVEPINLKAGRPLQVESHESKKTLMAAVGRGSDCIARASYASMCERPFMLLAGCREGLRVEARLVNQTCAVQHREGLRVEARSVHVREGAQCSASPCSGVIEARCRRGRFGRDLRF